MEGSGSECSVKSVFECNENEEFAALQRLVVSTAEFRKQVLTAIEKRRAREQEYARRKESNAEEISKLRSRIKEEEEKLESTTLRRKVIDKKVAHTGKQAEKLSNEIKEERARKEKLSLDMVDLQQDRREKKEEKMKQLNALKKACQIYKRLLGIHIKILETSDDAELVRVVFSQGCSEKKEEYYVDLLHLEKSWKVKRTKPTLKSDHKAQLENAVSFSDQRDLRDITAFLCQLRHIFVNDYSYTSGSVEE